MTVLKLIMKIVIAPVILLLTLAVWICVGLVYVSGLVLGLLSTVIALLGVAVLVTYSPQNGLILLVIAFLISPFGLPKLAFWLLGKVQDLKFAVQNVIYKIKISGNPSSGTIRLLARGIFTLGGIFKTATQNRKTTRKKLKDDET